MSHISNSSVIAFLHLVIKSFKPFKLIPISFEGAFPLERMKIITSYKKQPPHPKTLEKSFPVPKGTIPNGHFSTSIL